MLSKRFTFTAVVLALGLLIGCSSSLKSLAYPEPGEVIGTVQTYPPRFYGTLKFAKDRDLDNIIFPVTLTWQVPLGITWKFMTPEKGFTVVVMFYQNGKPICYGGIVSSMIRHNGKNFIVEVMDTIVAQETKQ